ncbi:MAG: YitT family protein [Clostridiaceae bacterium]|nr:YitT family protein [Clostridiaceae bacterium]
MDKRNDEIKRIVLDYLSIIVGCAVMASAYPMFLVPCRIAPGGVSGISTILNAYLGVPVGLTNFIICIPLFILGYKIIGRRFFFRSIVATALSSGFIDLLPLPSVTDNLLLAAIFGGVLLGIGLGLVMRASATTGGTDLAGALLHAKLSFFPVGVYVFAFDGLVIVAAAIFFSLEAALVAVIAVFVQSIILDRVIRGFDDALAYMIVSRENETISRRVMAELGRGVTLFETVGAFSGARSQTVLCVLRKTQVGALRAIIRETDPNAFVIAADVSEVMGEGFQRLG